MKFPSAAMQIRHLMLFCRPRCIILLMLTRCANLAAMLLMMATTALAADDSVPASSNVPGAQYPRVYPDRRVSFRLRAPNAQKVQTQPGGGDNGLGKGPFDMTKGDDGVWTVTIPPAAAGFHYYWFLIDGVPVNDPGSETYFGWGKQTSGVEIAEKGADFYGPRDVPHGEMHICWYHSKITESTRRCYVYMPPDYDTNAAARYPVLYLQPGAGEDERAWHKQGRMNFIIANLLASQKARPMLVVMDRGYASHPGDPPNKNSFGDVLLEEI